jgi:hypothetical protein
VQLLDWLVGRVGAEEVRGAAYRRRNRLQPRPYKVAEELGVKPPEELESKPIGQWKIGAMREHRAG